MSQQILAMLLAYYAFWGAVVAVILLKETKPKENQDEQGR